MAPFQVGLLTVGLLVGPALLDMRSPTRPAVRLTGWVALLVAAAGALAVLQYSVPPALPLNPKGVAAGYGALLLVAVWNDSRQFSHSLSSCFVGPLGGFALFAPSVATESGPLLAAAAAGITAGLPVALVLRYIASLFTPREAPAAKPRQKMGRGSVWSS